MASMRSIPFALLSVALLLPLSLASQAQPSSGPQPRQAQPAGRQVAAITLSGRYLAGRVAEQDHDYDNGAEQLDLALSQAPGDIELAYSAFRLRIYAGRVDAAAQLAPQLLIARPNDGLLNLVMAIQQIKKGDYRAAEQQVGRIGGKDQLGPLRDFVIAWLKAGQKDFVAARAALAKLKPGDANAQAPVVAIDAQIDEMAGDKAAAETKYRRAVELDPSALRVVLTAADGLRRLGKEADARAMLKAFGDKYSDSVVMDGLLAANAPMPKPPSPASGIAEIMFEIGSALNADPRNSRSSCGPTTISPGSPSPASMSNGATRRRRWPPTTSSARAQRCTGRRACGRPRSMRRRSASTRRCASSRRWWPRSPTGSMRR
jgi:predicted Zn-dependent protease